MNIIWLGSRQCKYILQSRHCNFLRNFKFQIFEIYAERSTLKQKSVSFHCFGKAADSDHKFTRKAKWSFSAVSNLIEIRSFVKTPTSLKQCENILRNIGWLLWNVKMMLCKYGKSFRLQHDLSVWPNSWKVRKHLHFNVKLPLEVHSVLMEVVISWRPKHVSGQLGRYQIDEKWGKQKLPEYLTLSS